jgi:hypothetical protein
MSHSVLAAIILPIVVLIALAAGRPDEPAGS